MGYKWTAQHVAAMGAVILLELQLCIFGRSCPESGQVLEVLVDATPRLLWGRPDSIWAEVISHDPGKSQAMLADVSHVLMNIAISAPACVTKQAPNSRANSAGLCDQLISL